MKKFFWICILLFTVSLPMTTFAEETQKLEGEWVTQPYNQYGVLPSHIEQNIEAFSTVTDSEVLKLADEFKKKFLERNPTFTIQYSGNTADLPNKIEQAINYVQYDNEFLSYDVAQYSWKADSWANESATLSFKFNYYQTKEQVDSVNKKITEILPTIIKDTDVTTRDQIKVIHDYIVTNVKYDTTMSQRVNAPYFALYEGKTICQGYAMLFYQMVKAQLGEDFPVRLISGDSTSGAHAWNLIQLDGVWYHVDVTWDDPIPDVAGKVRYDYYLVSSDFIKKDHFWEEGGLNGEEQPYPIPSNRKKDVGTGSIAITVLNDDKKTPITEELSVKITDKSDKLVTSTGDTISVTDGTFTSASTLAKGTYYVTISNGKIDQTTEVKVGPKKATVKLIWESTLEGLKDTKAAIKKSGAITGIVYNVSGDSAAVAIDATVKIVSKKTTWSVKTNKRGAFTVYVPTGTYDVIVEGKDSENVDDKKNIIYKKVKVTAGQASAPLEQMNAGLNWEEADKNLGFSLTKSSLTAKTIQGKALVNSIVSVYTVSKSDDSKTWIAEVKTNKTGAFSVKVPQLSGKQVLFTVKDEAGNIYTAPIENP